MPVVKDKQIHYTVFKTGFN